MVVVSRSLFVTSLLTFTLIAGLSNSTDVEAKKGKKEQEAFLHEPISAKKRIRFYKANKQLQASQVQLTGGDIDQAGCHNMLKKTRVFKTLQIGFSTCSLYQEKNCTIGSVVPVQSEKRPYSTYLMHEGVAWFPQDAENDRGVSVASWSCRDKAELEEGELRFEHDIAQSERNKMNTDMRKARKKLEKAQAEFAEAEKYFGKARDYADQVKTQAIAAGVVEPDPEPEEEEEGKDKQDDESRKNDKQS